MNTNKVYAERIASEYTKKEDSKVVALKKLDHKAKSFAINFSITFGTSMLLIFGLGLTLAMKVIGANNNLNFIIGIIIGIIGLIGISINYPIYKKLLSKGKEKYGQDILKLAKEISDSEL